MADCQVLATENSICMKIDVSDTYWHLYRSDTVVYVYRA